MPIRKQNALIKFRTTIKYTPQRTKQEYTKPQKTTEIYEKLFVGWIAPMKI